MKNLIKSTLITVLAISATSCSSLKVLNSWTEEGSNALENKNVLVITKVTDNTARVVSEEAIKNELVANGIQANESFKIFSMLEPNKKMDTEEVASAVKQIKDKGYNAVVLTTLKDYDETVYTQQTGGYYAGGGFYGGFYNLFGSYFGNVYSYYDRGVYVPGDTRTTVSKKYVLETVAFDLESSKDKELISVVTIQIEDPSNMDAITKKYAQTVVSRILKK